eukprot:727417_1
MMASKKVLLKIIILGESGVGKTALLHKYVMNKFIEEHKATIGADFLTKDITIGDKLITLQIWDTAGQERFQSLGNAFYRGADACILVYDITNQQSFNRIETWRNNFLHQSNPDNPESFPFLLCGNKSDLETQRQVQKEQVTRYANKKKCMKFYETSALTGQNLEFGIRSIANIASQSNNPNIYNSNEINVDLHDNDQIETNG